MERLHVLIRAARQLIASMAGFVGSSGTIVGLLLTGYLAILTVLGVRSRPPSSGTPDDCVESASTRFVVLVPAHDEASIIDDALRAFERLEYPSDLFDVHVVADNCTDATADLVELSPWHVHVRDDLGSPGKGAALNWLFDRLASESFDVAVIVDADTELDPGFLRALDRTFTAGAEVAQGYYSVRDPHESAGAAVRFMALAARHHLRPAGRMRIGGSCGLFGNGMAFRRNVLERHRWTGHLIEDMELQVELLVDDDIRVRYVPDAALVAEIPDNIESATSQNRRWERGRMVLARDATPALLRSMAGSRPSRQLALVDATLDLLVPPISVLGVVHTSSAAVGSIAMIAGNRQGAKILAVNGVLVALLTGHLVAALWSVRAPRAVYSGLRALPRMVIWKAGLWLSVLRDDDVGWERTERNRARLASPAPPARPRSDRIE